MLRDELPCAVGGITQGLGDLVQDLLRGFDRLKRALRIGQHSMRRSVAGLQEEIMVFAHSEAETPIEPKLPDDDEARAHSKVVQQLECGSLADRSLPPLLRLLKAVE